MTPIDTIHGRALPLVMIESVTGQLELILELIDE
jgi:hypothetical protein